MTATLLDYFWLGLAAAVAGGVNALAGGGTLLTFPTLIGFLNRIDPTKADVLANGTSTVALVPASLGSAWAFRRELHELRSLLVWLLPPSLIGGVAGALLVTRLDPAIFKALVPWLILAAATVFLLQPLLVRKKPQVIADDTGPVTPSSGLEHVTPLHLAGMVGLQLAIGIYGGYFGAGIGILMLSGLGLMGLTNIHQMNGLKSVLGTAINGIAVVIFVAEGKVVWPYALSMMATSVFGGFLAAHFSRQIPGKFVRWFVIAIGFLLSAYFFWQRYG